MSCFSFDRVSLWVAICVALALASPVSAQDDADPPTDAAPEAPATADPIVHAILVEAVAEYDAAHYAEAQALFRRASQLAPSGRTLRGLGMASYELRQYVTAIEALRGALIATERPLTDAQRAHVQELLDRALGFVARVRFTLTPADASVRIDGAIAAADADGAISVDPGRHLVVVDREGFEPETIDLSLEPGVSREITLALGALPAAAPPATSPRGDDVAWAGAALGIAAVVGLAVSATTGILALTDRQQLARDCDVYVCPASSRETRDRARDLSIVTDVVGTSAAVLGAAAIALSLVAALGNGGATASAFCTSDGCIATVRGAF